MARAPHFRAFARCPVNLVATLSSAERSFSRTVRVLNVGLGGACIELAGAAPAPAARLSLHVVAPHLWDPLTIPAEPVWSTPGSDDATTRVGVRFVCESGATLRALNELILAQRYD
ncbi:MAG TPA: PilZ domain-containing protein [Polyangiaceae bacterium]|jgi:hypothetical protein